MKDIEKEFIRLCRYVLDNIMTDLSNHNCKSELFYDDLSTFYENILIGVIRLIELSHDVYLKFDHPLSSYFIYNIICFLNRYRFAENKIDIFGEVRVSESEVDYGSSNRYIKVYTDVSYPRYFIYTEDRSMSSRSEKILTNISHYLAGDYKNNMGKIIIMTMYTFFLTRKAIKKFKVKSTRLHASNVNELSKVVIEMVYDRLDKYKLILNIVDSKLADFDINYIINSFRKRFVASISD